MTAVASGRTGPAAAASARRVNDGLVVALAQPQADPAHPGAGDLRDPPVDHVRAAVRVRVRRRDPDPGLPGPERLSRVPDARDLRPDDRRSPRRRRRSACRDDINKGIIDRFRSLPMARSAVLTGRTFVRRRLQRRHPGRADGDRLRGRLDASTPSSPQLLAGVALLLLLRLRDGLDRRLARTVGPDGRGRPAGRRSRSLPDHVRLERRSCRSRACRTGSSRSPNGTRPAR